MISEDIFSKLEKNVGVVKEEVVVKARSKRAYSLKDKKEKSTKVKKESGRDIIQDFSLQNLDEKSFGEVVLVNPDQSSIPGRKRVKYSVSQDVNRRFLITLEILERLAPYAKELGFTKSEFERNILKPFRKFISGKVKSVSKSEYNRNDGTVKLSSFQLPRKAKDEFDKLYHKLEKDKLEKDKLGKDDNDIDLSSVSYDNGYVSLLDASKTIGMYVTFYKLKDVKSQPKRIVLDDFLKGLFFRNENKVFKEKMEELYKLNKGEFIVQRQILTLASLLVNKLKPD